MNGEIMNAPTSEQQIRDLHSAFNRRDSSYVTARMSSEVTWPRAFEGGTVQGPDAVRAYWEKQWADIDPHVEPIGIARRKDGRYDVEVHQLVKDLGGAVIADTTVHHIYSFDGASIVSMEISADE
jgi:hypothetical protein